MFATTGIAIKPHITIATIAAVLMGVAATLPVQWRAIAKRIWSFGVYYLGYRLLAVQLSCGNVAVTGVPFVMKCAA